MERKSKKLVKRLKGKLAGGGSLLLNSSKQSQAKQIQALKAQAMMLAKQDIKKRELQDQAQLQQIHSNLIKAQHNII